MGKTKPLFFPNSTMDSNNAIESGASIIQPILPSGAFPKRLLSLSNPAIRTGGTVVPYIIFKEVSDIDIKSS